MAVQWLSCLLLLGNKGRCDHRGMELSISETPTHPEGHKGGRAKGKKIAKPGSLEYLLAWAAGGGCAALPVLLLHPCRGRDSPSRPAQPQHRTGTCQPLVAWSDLGSRECSTLGPAGKAETVSGRALGGWTCRGVWFHAEAPPRLCCGTGNAELPSLHSSKRQLLLCLSYFPSST